VQALCLRDFFSGFSAGIDEIRKFQLSGYANHICHPTSGHQILYLLRSWLFHGSWRLVRFKLHIFYAEFACRLFSSFLTERRKFSLLRILEAINPVISVVGPFLSRLP
jgi:hypothetical protein